jgi:hypothetical protein
VLWVVVPLLKGLPELIMLLQEAQVLLHQAMMLLHGVMERVHGLLSGWWGGQVVLHRLVAILHEAVMLQQGVLMVHQQMVMRQHPLLLGVHGLIIIPVLPGCWLGMTSLLRLLKRVFHGFLMCLQSEQGQGWPVLLLAESVIPITKACS